jgi:putative endonuclease
VAAVTDNLRILGAWGESIAAKYLQNRGYKILERNWRCARGEIDLIIDAGDILAFVEVKTRKSRAMGTPEEGLTAKKSLKLLELAQTYMLEKNIDVDWRIDMVAVECDTNGTLTRCDHLENVVWI